MRVRKWLTSAPRGPILHDFSAAMFQSFHAWATRLGWTQVWPHKKCWRQAFAEVWRVCTGYRGKPSSLTKIIHAAFFSFQDFCVIAHGLTAWFTLLFSFVFPIFDLQSSTSWSQLYNIRSFPLRCVRVQKCFTTNVHEHLAEVIVSFSICVKVSGYNRKCETGAEKSLRQL